MGAGPEQSRGQFPSVPAANIRSCEGRTRSGGSEATTRRRAGPSPASRESLASRSPQSACGCVDSAVLTAEPPATASAFRRRACGVEVGSCDGVGGAASPPVECFNRLGDGSAMVVPILLRRVLPRARDMHRRSRTPLPAAGGSRRQVLDHLRTTRAWTAAKPTRWSSSSTTSVRRWRASRGSCPRRRPQGPRGRDRALRGRVRQLPPAQDGDRAGWRRASGGAVRRPYPTRPSSETSRMSTASCGAARASTAASAIRWCSSSITWVSSAPPSRDWRGTAAASPRSTPRSRSARSAARTATGGDGQARRSFSLPRPKLCGAPVAQLVRAGDFNRKAESSNLSGGTHAPAPPAPPRPRGCARGRGRGPGR